ncbi:MAG: fasciclin domain-containing protein, partial [Bacteroidia bacterium]|nr:fasciclin domain-containing protein [Bacteroidia bacterium]
MKGAINIMAAVCLTSLFACNPATDETQKATVNTEAEPQAAGQSGVVDEVSNPNVVQIAVGSKDH